MRKLSLLLFVAVFAISACGGGGGSDAPAADAGDSDLPPAIAQCGDFPTAEPVSGFGKPSYKVCSVLAGDSTCIYSRTTYDENNQPVNEAWDTKTGAEANDQLSKVGVCVPTTQEHLEANIN